MYATFSRNQYLTKTFCARMGFFSTVRFYIVIAIALSLQSCGVPLSCYMWLQTKRYSGDGSIQTCSTLVASGYKITFPVFSAASSQKLTYRLSRLPQNFGVWVPKDPWLRLCFWWKRPSVDSDWIRDTTTASIKMKLVTEKGLLVREADISLSTMLWGETQDFHELWEFDKSRLHFDRNRQYVLEITYRPGAVPPPAPQLFFVIDNCPTY